MKDKFEALAKENGTTYEDETEKYVVGLGVPARRFGDAVDVGALCAVLCSQYASYIIGQSIVIDGGQVYSTF
jgi:3-oxoacyl-[acyl-carrier protein] reductase